MKKAGAAVAEVDLDNLLERAKKGIRPPELAPVGRCPHCHYDLTPVPPTFWGCTNEECCRMFWRLPRVSVLRRHDGSTPRGIRH